MDHTTQKTLAEILERHSGDGTESHSSSSE